MAHESAENISAEDGGTGEHDPRYLHVHDRCGCCADSAAWASGAVWSQEKAQQASGPHIQFGEGHFNRDGKAFHDWDKEKEIPAVCARCHAANGIPEYLRKERIRRPRTSRTHMPAPTATPTCCPTRATRSPR